MPDLEHKILYPNLNEDSDDDKIQRNIEEGHSNEEDDDDVDGTYDAVDQRARAIDDLEAERKARLARDPFGERRGGRVTGPKAVKADKAFHDDLKAKARDRDGLIRASVLLSGGGAGLAHGTDRAGTEASLRRILGSSGAGAAASAQAAGGADANQLANDDEDEDEDEFLASYRAARLKEMQSRAAASAALPSYGTVLDIHDAFDLPTVADGTPATTLCLVLLWEPYIPDCVPWVRAWEALAGRYPHTRWARLRSTVASPAGFDPLGLPSVVAYRGGKEVHVAVRPQDECGELVLLDDQAGDEADGAYDGAAYGTVAEDEDGHGHGSMADSSSSSSRARQSSSRTLAQALRTGTTAAGRRVTPATVEAWLVRQGLLQDTHRKG